MAFWVYMLRCSDGSYYTGNTEDLEARLAQHHAACFRDCYTARRRPLECVFAQEFESRVDALSMERRVKGWRRAKKEALVAGKFDLLRVLARTAVGRERSGLPARELQIGSRVTKDAVRAERVEGSVGRSERSSTSSLRTVVVGREGGDGSDGWQQAENSVREALDSAPDTACPTPIRPEPVEGRARPAEDRSTGSLRTVAGMAEEGLREPAHEPAHETLPHADAAAAIVPFTATPVRPEPVEGRARPDEDSSTGSLRTVVGMAEESPREPAHEPAHATLPHAHAAAATVSLTAPPVRPEPVEGLAVHLAGPSTGSGRTGGQDVERAFSEADRHWMHQALILADRAETELNEIPVGAILVDANGERLAEGTNHTIGTHDPTAHAEIVALRAAGKKTQNYRLTGTTLYVTLEPCAMCAMALVHARVARVVYAARDPKTGAAGSVFDLLQSEKHNHRIHVDAGLFADEASARLTAYFRRKRGKPA